MNRKIEKLVRCLAFAWLLTSPVLPTFGQFKTYDKVFEFDSLGYAKVCNNYDKEEQLAGIIDKSGREIVPMNYSDISVKNAEIAVVTQAGPSGPKGMQALFNLKSGKQITDFKYYYVYFDGTLGLGLAETEHGNIIIDSKGKNTKVGSFDDAQYLGDGFILQQSGENVKFYNLYGKLISDKIFKDVYHYDDWFVKPQNGWLQVWYPKDETHYESSYWLCNDGTLLSDAEYMIKVEYKDDNYVIVDDTEMNEKNLISTKDGSILGAFKADACWHSGDSVIVKKGKEYFIKNLKGEDVAKLDLSYLSSFSEDLAYARDSQGKSCFVDRKGNKVIDYEGKVAYYPGPGEIWFSEGLAPYREDRRKGFINKKGEVVIPAQFSEVYSFIDGHAVVRDFDHKYGMIDKNGNIVVPLEYKGCRNNTKGYAIVVLQDGKETILKLAK